jgi:Peptidase M50B-like
MTPSFGTMVSRIGETQAPLSAAGSVLIGLIALAVVGVQGIWEVARYVDTIAHEGMHAVAGSALGRKVHGVTLRRNGDGETRVSQGGFAGNVLIYFVGYLGPSAFGLGAAKLIGIGHSVAVLWLTLLLLIVLLVLLREWFSFVSVLVTGVLLFMVARYAAVGTQTAVAYGVAWFLLLSGVRKVIYRGTGAGDAGNLASMTHIGRSFWVLLWLAGSVAAVAVGGALLV